MLLVVLSFQRPLPFQQNMAVFLPSIFDLYKEETPHNTVHDERPGVCRKHDPRKSHTVTLVCLTRFFELMNNMNTS